MNKKVLSSLLGIIPLLFAGYYLFQNLSGNTDLMLTYLEDSSEITNEYNQLIELESQVESEEELATFTDEVLIPSLEAIITKSETYGASIKKEELKEIHNIQDEAFKNHLEAELAWLAGEDATVYYEEVDRLFVEYEDQLNQLAKKWGVEIEWEEVE